MHTMSLRISVLQLEIFGPFGQAKSPKEGQEAVNILKTSNMLTYLHKANTATKV